MTERVPTDWLPCPSGEVTQLVARLAFRKTMLALATAASVFVAGTAIVATAWYATSPSSPSPPSKTQDKIESGELKVQKPFKSKLTRQ